MRQKPYKLDPHTFGGTKASENLTLILMDNPRLIRSVACQYHKYTRDLTNIMYSFQHFKDTGLLQELMSFHKQKRFDRVKNSGYPSVVESHLLNIMQVAYAEKLRIIKNLSK